MPTYIPIVVSSVASIKTGALYLRRQKPHTKCASNKYPRNYRDTCKLRMGVIKQQILHICIFLISHFGYFPESPVIAGLRRWQHGFGEHAVIAGLSIQMRKYCGISVGTLEFSVANEVKAQLLHPASPFSFPIPWSPHLFQWILWFYPYHFEGWRAVVCSNGCLQGVGDQQ